MCTHQWCASYTRHEPLKCKMNLQDSLLIYCHMWCHTHIKGHSSSKMHWTAGAWYLTFSSFLGKFFLFVILWAENVPFGWFFTTDWSRSLTLTICLFLLLMSKVHLTFRIGTVATDAWKNPKSLCFCYISLFYMSGTHFWWHCPVGSFRPLEVFLGLLKVVSFSSAFLLVLLSVISGDVGFHSKTLPGKFQKSFWP